MASVGSHASRILFIKDSGSSWPLNVVDGNRIVLIGPSVEARLRTLLTDNGRPTMNRLIPDGISPSAYTALRKHLGL